MDQQTDDIVKNRHFEKKKDYNRDVYGGYNIILNKKFFVYCRPDGRFWTKPLNCFRVLVTTEKPKLMIEKQMNCELAQ